MLCLLGLSACSSFGWPNTGVNSASALTPPTSIYKYENKNTMLALGKSFAKRGEHNAAIPILENAHYNNKGSSVALLYLGKSLMAVGRYDEAIDALIAAKNKSPNDQEILISLGQLYLTLHNPSTAKGYFSAAIATSKQSKRGPSTNTATAYSGLGVSLELLGEHNKAQEAFDRGLALNGENMNLLSNKALSLALAGEASRAIEILQAITTSPQAQSQHRQNLALVYVFEGDSVRAWQTASIDMSPNMAEKAVASFYILKGLEGENRMHALVYGMSAPRSGLERVANNIPLNPDGSAASKRIAPKTAVPIVAKVEVAAEDDPQLPPLLDPSGWAVQIGAYRKAEEIIRGWTILKNKYFDIIGQLEPRRSEVNFADRSTGGPSGFYYRLNAGPLSGYKQSRDVCTALIRAGGKCWIRPPEPSEGKLPKQN
jgi:Flp pilus assembly protein TadD